MEVSFSTFRIDALLSLSPPAALPSRPQPRQLRTGSGGCCSLHPPSQPGSAGSSFLIRNILADCVYPGPGRAEEEAEEFQSGPGENTDVSCASSDTETRAPDWTSDQTSSCGKKPRKARTAFSDQQLSRLESSFHKQKYLSVQERMELAAALKLSDIQVKTWYQNRRTKWKRQSAAGLELLSEAGRLFLPTPYLCPAATTTVDLFLYGGHALRPTATRGSERALTLDWSNGCDVVSERRWEKKNSF